MLQDLPAVSLLVTAAALSPAMMLWWRGRALARALDDPALPEQLHRERRRHGSLMVLVFIAIGVTAPMSILWALPLLFIGHLIAAYPLRKALYEESWTLAGYLSFIGRVAFGVWGFWFVLATLPYSASLAGRYDWLAAALTMVVLLVWNARYVDVLRRVLRSRPVTDAALAPRFAALAGRSSIAAPRFEWIPLGGGAIPNAVALPALPQSSVLFTETLLQQLDHDEVTAICAHEIAHIEHHTPRLLRRLNAGNVALIVTAAAFAAVPRALGWDGSPLLGVIWLALFAAVTTMRARNRQKHETASDLRAVTLCGDAEALVRALTKLYTFAREPRRVDAEVERHATHPSLARRIRDIRAAAGSGPVALGETSPFAAADGRASVTFDRDRLHWSEGDVATHSVSYSQFSELRLDVNSRRGPSLLAVERGGRQWQMTVSPADVARLQSVLDVVDGRLGDPVGAPSAFGSMARLVAAMAVVIAIAFGHLAVALAALLALLQPSAPMLAGAGVAALGMAVAGAQLSMQPGWEPLLGMAAVLALLGTALVGAAYARRHDELPPRIMAGVTLLGLATLVSCSSLAINGLHPVHLHLSARAAPAAGVLLLGFSAALFCLRSRAGRCAAAPLAMAGIVAASAGSTWFLDRFGDDPFLEPAQPFTWADVKGTIRAEMKLPFYAVTAQLSPGGHSLIVGAIGDHGDATPFHVGRVGGSLRRLPAADPVFVDDDHVLALYDDVTDGAELRVVRVDAPDRPVWRGRIPALSAPDLSFAPATRTWRVRGIAEGGAFAQIAGVVGSDAVTETQWPLLGPGRMPDVSAVSGTSALVMETEYLPSFVERGGWWRAAVLLHGGWIHSRFTRMTTESQSELTVTRLTSECISASLDRERLLCTAFDGTRTRFATVDPETGGVTPLAWTHGRFSGSTMASSGWFSGWLDSHAVAIHPASREGVRLLASTPERVTHLTATERMLAAVSFAPGGSIVRVYSFDGISSQLSASSGR